MNNLGYSYKIDNSWEKSVFMLISATGACFGKIMYAQRVWRFGNIYTASLLWTANGWAWLDKVWLDGIEKVSEKIPWLLYTMFILFIEYIRASDNEAFSVNIEKQLLTLECVYKKLYKKLIQEQIIESWTVTKETSVFKCT